MNVDLNKFLNDATIKSKQGDHEKAIDICNGVISEFPECYEAYETRSEIFYRMGNYQDALLDLDRVIKLEPDEPAPLFRRGRWKLNLGDYQEAIEDFTKVIESQADYFNDSAHYFRALSYFYSKEYQKALTDCKHVPDDFFIGPKYLSKEVLINQSQAKINGTVNDTGS